MAGVDFLAPVQNVTKGISWSGIVNAVWVLVAGIIIIAAGGAYIWWWWNKKQFSKRIEMNELIGGQYIDTAKDMAKLVKLGSGGYEILFCKKLKTWLISYGNRVGRNTYKFYVGQDGYPYPALISGNLSYIDKEKGYMPVIVANPLMRAQYTALEKQINELHAEKKSFMDKWGNWVFGIGTMMIVLIFLWLLYREAAPLMSQFVSLTDRLTQLVDKINSLTVNTVNSQSAGTLVKA